MNRPSTNWLFYLALFWRFLCVSSQNTSLPAFNVNNVTACQTYNVSWDSGFPPFTISASNYGAVQEEAWSIKEFQAQSANFPIFFSPGTTASLSVTDGDNIIRYQGRFQVSGNPRHAACANTSNATSTALSSELAAVGPCDPTNLQWENQDTSVSGSADITIETLNLVQNMNHTIFSVTGTGVRTQIRMPPGVEYRVLVAETSQQAYASSGALVVQNMTNQTCLINNYNPSIDTTVSIATSTTASLPTITITSHPSSSNHNPLVLGLSIPLSLLFLLCVSLCFYYRHKRNQPKRDLPSSISGMGFATQLANLNPPRRREETNTLIPSPARDRYEEEYREKVSQGEYVVVTARDDPYHDTL